MSNLIDRRQLFQWGVHGLGATALLQLLLNENTSAGVGGSVDGNGTRPLVIPKAKRAIQICLVGGLSHLDSFDYKPALEQFHGKTANYKK